MDAARVYSNFGPLAEELKGRFADLLGVQDQEKLVLASSATMALEGACRVFDVAAFLVPTYTFPATGHALVRAGKRMVLTDIAASNWQLDTSAFDVSSDVGVLRVMPFGAGPELHQDQEAGALVIDAAASLGAANINLGSLAANQAVIFSLHATKVHGIGEGGMAVFGSVSAARRFRTWLNFGFNGTRQSEVLGTNGKMAEAAAAYGLAVLDSREEELASWRTVNTMAREVSEAAGVASIVSHYEGVSPYWIAQFESPAAAEDAVQSLARSGIETRRWWEQGIHRMNAFRSYDAGSYPVTSEISATTVGLPMFRDLKRRDFDRIADVLCA
jgi:dTDP-4-amino-4,6-dideoxygalactose transaminase